MRMMRPMHLSRLPSGHWRVAVKHHGRRRTATRPTKNEARQAGAELLYELGATPKSAGITVTELLGAWTAQAQLSITYAADCHRVIDQLPAEFTARRIVTLTPASIEALYRQLGRDGWSAHRIGRVHDVLSAACTLALRYEWLATNPAHATRRPKTARSEVAPPTPAQVATLLAAAPDELRLYLLVSAELGARRGEVVALQWSDIGAGAVNIRRSRAYAPGAGVVTTTGKTGRKGHRVVAIDQVLADELAAHRVAQVKLAVAAGLPSPLWVFSHNAGVTPWRPDYATHQFVALRRRCGIEGVRLHDLRHYVATQLLAAGVPLKVVGDRLGHRQLSTTSDTYGAYVPAADRAAAEIMAGLRRKKSTG